MTNGFVMVTRDYETGGVYVETIEDWNCDTTTEIENEQRRMIYCQAVSDMEQVREKIEQWLEENDGFQSQHDNLNDAIADMVSSIQWIANEYPLQCFRHPSPS